MKRLIASLAAAMLMAPALAAQVHFSVGNRIFSSFDSGVSFAETDTQVWNASTNAAADRIVSIGQKVGGANAGFYAVTGDGWLNKISGLGTANATVTRFHNFGTGDLAISFDFFGDTMYGMRSGQLFTLNMNSLAYSTLGGGNNTVQLPATARVGNDYFGMRNDGSVHKVNLANGGQSLVGASGLGNVFIAGGSSNAGAYDRFFVTAGYGSMGQNGTVKFGWINPANGSFTQIGSTLNVANMAQGMGMVYVIPVPAAALLGLLGMGVVAMTKRR